MFVYYLHTQDMEDGLLIQDDTPHDPDPEDDLLAAKGRSSYIATAALAQVLFTY